MYDPAAGRFTTRDSWQGDYNKPMSLNHWNYVHSNPVNYFDPTGKRPACVFWAGWNQASIEKRIDYAEKIVSPNSSDELNTYVAAAIAVQCAGRDEWWNKNSGIGSAQITQNQVTTKYGEVIPERNWRGDIIYEDGKPKIRNFGLCPDGATLDPMDDQDAVILMRLLLQLTIDKCKGCTSTDIFIASGLTQNGPGFNNRDMQFLPELLSDADRQNLKINRDWFGRFTTDLQRNNGENTKTQLERFSLVINELVSRGWYIPDDQIDFSWTTIKSLRNWTVNSAIPTQVNP
jgi:hypothetical protein